MCPALAGLRGIMPEADPPLAETLAGIHFSDGNIDSRWNLSRYWRDGNDRNGVFQQSHYIIIDIIFLELGVERW